MGCKWFANFKLKGHCLELPQSKEGFHADDKHPNEDAEKGHSSFGVPRELQPDVGARGKEEPVHGDHVVADHVDG